MWSVCWEEKGKNGEVDRQFLVWSLEHNIHSIIDIRVIEFLGELFTTKSKQKQCDSKLLNERFCCWFRPIECWILNMKFHMVIGFSFIAIRNFHGNQIQSNFGWPMESFMCLMYWKSLVCLAFVFIVYNNLFSGCCCMFFCLLCFVFTQNSPYNGSKFKSIIISILPLN